MSTESTRELPFTWDGAVGFWLTGVLGENHPAATEEERDAALIELESALRGALQGSPPQETSAVVRAMLGNLGAVRASLEHDWELKQKWRLHDVDVNSEEVTLAVLSIPDLTTENLRQQDVGGHRRSLGYVWSLLAHPACTEELLVDVVERGWNGRPERSWPKVGALRLLAQQGGAVEAAVTLVQLPVRGMGGLDDAEFLSHAKTLGEVPGAAEVVQVLAADRLQGSGRSELDPQEVAELVEQAALLAQEG